MKRKSNTLPEWLQSLSAAWHASQLRLWSGYPTLRLCAVEKKLPRFVRRCPITMSIRRWLVSFNWSSLPVSSRVDTISTASYIAAYLIKLDQKLPTLGALRRFLQQHPALVWGLGFPLVFEWGQPYGFSADKSLPSRQQLGRILRQLPNERLQQLLTAQVKHIQRKMPPSFGRVVSLDTKHILAWVKENNPKVFAPHSHDKSVQPAGDPDCKLGCKKARNQKSPTKEGQPLDGSRKVGEFYWGYASGAVVTKVADLGEFVLAEWTQTFDRADVTYFFPLMQATEKRLGFRPTFATADAAFDAFYVYEYFHRPDREGGAMIPLNQPNKQARLFNDEGLPLCQAHLPMPVRKTYTDRTKTIIHHQRAFHACPLLFPEKTADSCPINHKQWPKGGCSVQIPTSIGARLRHQLDRDGKRYSQIYKQRTAVERIFSQATSLGIERPKLRNQLAIANINTLTYLLINARSFLRAKSLATPAR